MRGPVVTIVALLVGGLGCNPPGPKAVGNFHRYPIDHAHVHYEYSGLARGSGELYFDQYGKREAKIEHWEHIEAQGMRRYLTLNLALVSDIYAIQFDRGEGFHWKDPDLDSLFHLPTDETPGPEASTKLYLSDRAVLSSTDTVLGLRADVWQTKGLPVKLYIWKSILLERQSLITDDTVIMRATSVDTSTPIPDAIFGIPKQIHIVEREAPPRVVTPAGP